MTKNVEKNKVEEIEKANEALVISGDNKSDLHKHVVSLMETFCEMDRLAKAEGHSLAEVLIIGAKNAFGINIRPADPTPETEEA